MDVSLGLDLVVVWQTIHFVYEHFKVDLRIDSVGSWHSEVKPAQSLHIIILQERFIFRSQLKWEHGCDHNLQLNN